MPYVVLGVVVLAFVAYVWSREPAPPARAPSPEPPSSAKSPLRAELLDLRSMEASPGGKTRIFVGLIKNVGDAPFGHPSGTVRFYDGDTQIESAECSSIDPLVPPGASTPCFFPTFKGKPYTRYEVQWQLLPPSPKVELSVSDVKLIDVHGVPPLFTVEGKITNKGSTKAKSVTAIVSLYGLDGKIVGAEQGLVEGADLEPGQTAAFSVAVLHFAARALSAKVTAAAAL